MRSADIMCVCVISGVVLPDDVSWSQQGADGETTCSKRSV